MRRAAKRKTLYVFENREVKSCGCWFHRCKLRPRGERSPDGSVGPGSLKTSRVVGRAEAGYQVGNRELHWSRTTVGVACPAMQEVAL